MRRDERRVERMRGESGKDEDEVSSQDKSGAERGERKGAKPDLSHTFASHSVPLRSHSLLSSSGKETITICQNRSQFRKLTALCTLPDLTRRRKHSYKRLYSHKQTTTA